MNIISMLCEGERKKYFYSILYFCNVENGTKTNNTEVGETILKYHTFTDTI
jgi:hypothetical protein